jgi:hypothetical protein
MKYLKRSGGVLALLAVVALGCDDDESSESSSRKKKTGNTNFALTEEPEGSIDVIKARETIKDGDEIVMVGRVGGQVDPWNKGKLASFRIVDTSLKSCEEAGHPGCEFPWDFC